MFPFLILVLRVMGKRRREEDKKGRWAVKMGRKEGEEKGERREVRKEIKRTRMPGQD